MMPRSASALTRARSSSLIAAAVALPSRIVAVTPTPSLADLRSVGGRELRRLRQVDRRSGDADLAQRHPVEVGAAQVRAGQARRP